MNYSKWIDKNAHSLEGMRIAISGSTGGLGTELCEHLCRLGAELIFLNRSIEKSEQLTKLLKNKTPKCNIKTIVVDFEDIESVRDATEELKEIEPHVLILNAGAYSIPRHKTSAGYDNVYQINFASCYYMVKELLPSLRAVGGRVVAVGSIAHNYSKIDECDIDFSLRNASSKVYGNAKRQLMFSLFELFKNEDKVSLSIVHPGITFTNITAHYPRVVFSIIKYPMKVIFMSPKKASLSILRGIFDSTEYHTWIGPRIFNIWGTPIKKRLKTCSIHESERIAEIAEKVYLVQREFFDN